MSSITCYGGVGKVTGANFLFESGGKKILVDCGLLQGDRDAHESNSADFEYNPGETDVLIVTHAHTDHIGRIPKLVHDGFKGVIYSTSPTQRIVPVMYEDALGIMGYHEKKTGEKPIYSKKDVENALALWQSVPYHKEVRVGDVAFSFKDAGHILGSAMVEIKAEGKTIMFSGDLGNSPSPLLRDTEVIEGVDYLLMESVYGDRNHESNEERDRKFKEAVKDTLERGGTVLIPAFSLERTQIILFQLNNLIESGEIKSVPVFLDSPLGIAVTDIYKQSKEYFNDFTQKQIESGDDIFAFPNLQFTDSTRESKQIGKTKGAKIILAGSGMSVGGRVINHERELLPDPQNTLLLVGYQAQGSLGRRLEEGAKSVTIYGETIPVRAQVKKVEGFSSHKDSEHLLEYVAGSKDTLKKVFVAMGEPKSSLFLAQRIKDFLGVEAVYPERGKKYELN